MKRLILICFAAFMASTFSFAANKVEDTFTPLEPGSIQLNGALQNDIENVMEHWNLGVLPYQSIEGFFYWGAPQFALGEMWGKAVRSGCMLYRYNHDPRLKTTMKESVYRLLGATRSNGSLSTIPVERQPDSASGDMWERKYVLLGLDEYYRQVEQDPKVLEAMMKQADCIIDQVGPEPKVPITSMGWSPNHIESSTLLEPFMRLYGWTGEQRYLDFAAYIVSTGGSMGYDIFRQAYDNVRPRLMGGPYPKAYEMMSVFEGLVDYYRVTGDEYCKTAAINLYHNIMKYELTIIGNAGGDQPYHPAVCGEAWDDTALEQTNPDITRMMETCVGVTWMKFASHILRLTGDPVAVDAIENYVYNGLIGAMMPSGEGFSYVNMLNGRKCTNQGWGWEFGGLMVTCCNLNGPMGMAYIPYVAVMNSKEGPVVNLWNACDATAKTPSGKNVKLNLDTTYPYSEKIVMTVTPDQAENFTVKLRIPSWTEAPVVKVAGKAVSGVVPGQYLDLKRTWNAGDKVEITFPMACHKIDAPHGSNRAGDNFVALKYGPIVLARDENIDRKYNEPVNVKADAKGIVKIKGITPTLTTARMEFLVPTNKGKVHMVDYASVNCWGGLNVCTWLPMDLEAK